MDRLFAEGAGARRRFLDRLVLALEPGHARNAARAVGARLVSIMNPEPHLAQPIAAELGVPVSLGVDGAAHRGALEGAAAGQLATIAVVGTGLDRVYPKSHRALAHQIALRGLILSEYPLGTPPLAPNFPRRNRLISGAALGSASTMAASCAGVSITA